MDRVSARLGDLNDYSSTGLIGHAVNAGVELGARLWEAVVDEVASTLWSIAEEKGEEHGLR